jgi:hypothetical protein
MLGKIICVFLLSTSLAYGAIGKIATIEQLETLCVAIQMTVDEDLHWFHYKQIESFDENGAVIKWGKGLSKKNKIYREEIMNFEEAKAKYERLKVEQP